MSTVYWVTSVSWVTWANLVTTITLVTTTWSLINSTGFILGYFDNESDPAKWRKLGYSQLLSPKGHDLGPHALHLKKMQAKCNAK